MKKNIQILLIGLAVTLQGSAFAVDTLMPMKPTQMQQFENSPFENYQPNAIEESKQRKQDALDSAIKMQEQIERRLNQIDETSESGSDLKGNVAEQTFISVQRVEFPNSAIFSQAELQKFAAPLVGRTVSMDEVNKVVEAISKEYVKNDYFTSRAYIPEQNVQDGVLRIGLYEGRVGKIIVENNKWTRSSYITKRIDTKEGELFKLRALEKQILTFNNTNDVKLNVKIQPGKEVGTTDVVVRTDNKLPFHITGVFDNQGRYNTGVLRGGAILSADSVFGIRDKFAGGGYFGKSSQVAFADYNAPINENDTRVGASFSFNNVRVTGGPYRHFGIKGRTFAYTGYVNHPIIKKPNMQLNSYTSGNVKLSSTYAAGRKLYNTNSYSGTQGINARWDTEKGIWLTGHYATVGFFDSYQHDRVFFKYEGSGTRIHDFGHGIVGEFRLGGQWSPTRHLPWLEQYQNGGMATIRGYSEGVLLGRSGYNATAEIVTPIPILPKRIGTEKRGYISPRDIVKFAVFVDHGGVFMEETGGLPHSQFLLSAGLGLRVNITNEILARMYWGFPFINTVYEDHRKVGRFHFELAARPDLTRLVRHKNKKKESL